METAVKLIMCDAWNETIGLSEPTEQLLEDLTNAISCSLEAFAPDLWWDVMCEPTEEQRVQVIVNQLEDCVIVRQISLVFRNDPVNA